MEITAIGIVCTQIDNPYWTWKGRALGIAIDCIIDISLQIVGVRDTKKARIALIKNCVEGDLPPEISTN